MSLPLRCRPRVWIIAGALLLLGGCSTLRLAYNQGPALAYWWLDGYFDFDAAQAADARQALGEWFAWHRTTQLPDYAALLARARQRIAHDLSAAEVCEWSDALRHRLERGYEHGVPALARLLLSLTPQQVSHVEQRFKRADDEFRADHLQATRAERLAALTERTAAHAERVYGALDEAQRQALERDLAASPFDPEAWLGERQARQREIVAGLRALQGRPDDVARAEAALRAFAAHAAVSPRPAYRRYQQQLRSHNCALVARLHNGTSAQQRGHAALRLQGWEDDLRALAAQRPVELERSERP